jgi:hypothetical protein
MNNNLDLVVENINLKKQIKLYETSSKLDYEKILKLKEEIEELTETIYKLKIENKYFIPK